jgi:hypothetical protein
VSKASSSSQQEDLGQRRALQRALIGIREQNELGVGEVRQRDFKMSGRRHGLGKGRGCDLDDQIAAMFQLILHRHGFRLVPDDGHAGFVGPSRVPV